MVKKIIAKPFLFFFGLIPLFIFLAFFSKDKLLDINIYDTYFVVPYFHFYLFSAIFSAMISFNYFALYWADKPPKKWLTIIHILLQLLALLLIITSNKWNWLGNQNTEEMMFINDNSNLLIVISFLIFLLSVFIHFINFLVSLLLKKS